MDLLGHIGCFEFCKIRQPPPVGQGGAGDQSVPDLFQQRWPKSAEITKRAASGSNTVI